MSRLKKRRIALISFATVIGLLGLLLGIGYAIRAKFHRHMYPKPATMPAVTSATVATLLPRLEQSLSRHAPQVIAGLQPGLPEERVQELQDQYAISLPPELVELYKWRDGCSPSWAGNIIPGHSLVPLEHALENRASILLQVNTTFLQRLAGDFLAGYRKGWIQILDDGAGDGFFYDPARRPMEGQYCYYMPEGPATAFFPCLANMLQYFIEAFESGAFRQNPNVQLDEDYRKADELLRKYAAVLPTQD
jgi:cell wall assembly regulator SMI1